MSFLRSLFDLGRGISKHPVLLAAYSFTAFSVITTLGQGVDFFVPGVEIKGKYPLLIAIFVSLFYGIKKIWKPSKIEFIIPTTNTTVEIIFGDLFKQSGIRAISVNEFFDSKIGRPVSQKSLHGLLIKTCFASDGDAFDAEIVDQLKNYSFTNVPVKVEGKTKAYPIGTSVLISINNYERYICFALAKSNPNDCKAYSDVTMMWDALHDMWQLARSECGGDELNIPLVGSGLSGLGLPTRDLINLIVLSVITESKAKQITTKIRLVLHRDRFDDLDLREVKKHWEE